MRILYVTPLYSGTENVIRNNSKEYTGLPSFVKIIQELRLNGHHIDFIVLDQQTEVNKQIQKITDDVYYINWKSNNFKKIFSLIKKMRDLIKDREYDFVYGHGSIGALTSIIANIYKIPTGQRLYGVYPILKNINKGKSAFTLFLGQPLYYLTFKLKKKFLIVTNDGTQGDYVNKKINKSRKEKFQFYFWTNGVDDLHYNDKLNNIDEKFIFYPGRISEQKQQVKVLDVIENLKRQGINIKFYFAGTTDTSYYNEVIEEVHKRDLTDNAIFLGPMNREEMAFLYKNSIATVLLYDISSRGNTALEALRCGSLIITYNNNGLDEFIENEINGFLVNNPIEVSKIIDGILNNTFNLNEMKKRAKETADSILETWDERAKKEVRLIESTVDRKSVV